MENKNIGNHHLVNFYWFPMHIPCLIFSSQVHQKLVSPSSWTVGGFESGTVSLDSGKIVGRQGGDSSGGPGRESVERSSDWKSARMFLKDDGFARANAYIDTQMDSNGLFFMSTNIFITVLFKRGSYMYWQHAPSLKCLTSHLSLPWALRPKTRRPRPKIRNVSPKNCSRHVAAPFHSQQLLGGVWKKKMGMVEPESW